MVFIIILVWFCSNLVTFALANYSIICSRNEHLTDYIARR